MLRRQGIAPWALGFVCVIGCSSARADDRADQTIQSVWRATQALRLELSQAGKREDLTQGLLAVAEQLEALASKAEPDNAALANELRAQALQLRRAAQAPNENDVETLLGLLDALKEAQALERESTGKITAGFGADSSEQFGTGTKLQDDLYKITTSAKITRGGYPTVLEIAADIGVQLKGKTFQEDVTKFSVSYDYATSDKARVAGFAERFSDNYLGINQRWEVGAEVSLNTERGAPRGKRREAALGKFCNVDTARGAGSGQFWKTCLEEKKEIPDASLALVAMRLEKGVAEPEKVDVPKAVKAIKDELDRSRTNAIRSLRRREAPFQAGLGLGVQGELERAALKVLTVDENGLPTTTSVTLEVPGENRFRLRVRPFLTLRPTAHLSVSADCRLKFPFPLNRRVSVYDQESVVDAYDFRYDLQVITAYTLEKDETSGKEKATFKLSWLRFFDNAPPSVQTETRVVTTVGAASHDVLKLEFGIEW